MKNMFKILINKHAEYATYAIWFISWGSVFGSLYFSEILGYIPCELCWYQRILMYPLAFITTVAIIRKEFASVMYYTLPFSLIGLVMSFYHSLLQWGVITHNVLNCSEGAAVPCSDPEIMVFGFITIPFLAFISFFAITLVASVSMYLSKKDAS